MFIKEITKKEYENICPAPRYFYNSAAFHNLNENKVDKLYFFQFASNKRKLALAGGVEDNVLKIPYSAPYGIFEKLQKHIKIEEIEEALVNLEDYVKERGITKIIFRLPPHICDESFITKIENSLIRNGYFLYCMDINYHFNIVNLDSYVDSLYSTARNNLRRAIKENFIFQKCDSEEEYKRVYEVIKINRKRKNYPLRMSFEQIMDTIRLTESDFFLLKYGEDDVAAAIIFKVNSDSCQIIYWGDIAGYESKKPMNLLAYYIYCYYCDKGIALLDVGISTEDGIPNYGLCDYKESVGCEISMKNTYIKNI